MSHLLVVEMNSKLIQLDCTFTVDDEKKAQQEDSDLLAIIESVRRSTWIENEFNKMQKVFADIKEKLFLDDGILYRQHSDEFFQVIIPPALYSTILQL